MELVERVRSVLSKQRGVVDKRMFGGVGFLLDGNLLVAVWKNQLIARLGIDEAEAALKERFTRPFDVTGKPMKGWVMVEPDGIESDRDLRRWLERATKFVATLPAKTKLPELGTLNTKRIRKSSGPS